MTIDKDILHHLLGIKDVVPGLADGIDMYPYSYKCGICSNVCDHFMEVQYEDEDYSYACEEMEWAIKLWPDIHMVEDDMDYVYPVGGELQYYEESERKTFWRNPRRLALLDFLITYFQEKVNERKG